MRNKWIFPAIILMIWPYLFFLCFLFPSKAENELKVFLYTYTVMTAAVYAANILYACLSRKHSVENLAFWDLVIKAVHIPFYLIVFAIGIFSMLMMVVPAFSLVSPMIVAMLSIIDYLLLITSSAYGINALWKAKREKTVTQKYAVLHTILHLFFITDIISSKCVYCNIRKK